MAVLDAHLAQRVGGDDERGDDAHEPGAGERVAEDALELDELRSAPAVPQLPQAPAAVAHELALEGLEGGVARRGVGEELVEHQGVGAELAQALRLRRREADAEDVGLVGRHDASSSSSGTRAR